MLIFSPALCTVGGTLTSIHLIWLWVLRADSKYVAFEHSNDESTSMLIIYLSLRSSTPCTRFPDVTDASSIGMTPRGLNDSASLK